MNVVALNSSPNLENGHTWEILGPLVEAMEKGGADVAVHQIQQMNIEPCRGCMTCWKTGECVIDDDMKGLVEQIGSCDLLVLGAPVYVDAMPGPLKTTCDRMLPLVSPDIVMIDGHCRHPAVEGVSGPKRICLVSVCGFYERDNFDPLVTWVEAVCRNFEADLAGTIIRPHVHGLGAMSDDAPPKQSVMEGISRAGQALARAERVPRGVEDAIAAPLFGLDTYLRVVRPGS